MTGPLKNFFSSSPPHFSPKTFDGKDIALNDQQSVLFLKNKKGNKKSLLCCRQGSCAQLLTVCVPIDLNHRVSHNYRNICWCDIKLWEIPQKVLELNSSVMKNRLNYPHGVQVDEKDRENSYIGDKLKEIITFSTKVDGDLMKKVFVWLRVSNYCIRILTPLVSNF